jgi:anti-sigma regulatory factor (Ser/Thr protein kinase)
VVANPVVARPVAAKHAVSEATAAVSSTSASGLRAVTAAPDAGWGWLRRAAEMATQAGSLPSAAPDGVRYVGEPGWPCYPRIAMRTPGSDPSAISAARKFTTLIMERWGAASRGADVAVVVSELLSNAVRHGLALTDGPVACGIRLGLLHSGPSILCAVTDPSDSPPVPREPDWLDEGGRGLHVIASLSDGWGACLDVPGQAGKVVWAAFRTAP